MESIQRFADICYDYHQHCDPLVPRYYKLKIINHQLNQSQPSQGLSER